MVETGTIATLLMIAMLRTYSPQMETAGVKFLIEDLCGRSNLTTVEE